MFKKGCSTVIVLATTLSVTGCFSAYYHKTSHESSQQYKTEQQVIETQQDQFKQFALARGATPPKDGLIQHYYILGERYIYQLPYTKSSAIVLAQQLDARYFKLDSAQPIQVSMKVEDNPEQYISVRYTLKYMRSAQETPEAERQVLRSAGFKVYKNYYAKEERLLGRLIQPNEQVKIQQSETQNFNQIYQIQLEFYQEKRVKDGYPVLNNVKGYGATAVLDLITLPLQLLSF